jgi:hypothetical protein
VLNIQWNIPHIPSIVRVLQLPGTRWNVSGQEADENVPKEVVVLGDWRKFSNLEAHNLCSSTSVARRCRAGKVRRAYRISVGKHEGKETLEGLRIDGSLMLKLFVTK